MGLKKSGTQSATPAAPAAVETKPDSGTAAAVSRLKAAKTEIKTESRKEYRSDSEETARGKTRCALFEAALMSPAIAGMPFENNIDKFLELVEKAAERGVAYTFQDAK